MLNTVGWVCVVALDGEESRVCLVGLVWSVESVELSSLVGLFWLFGSVGLHGSVGLLG